MDKQTLLNDINNNISLIKKCNWFVNKLKDFLNNTDEEVHRLARLSKKIAECPMSKENVSYSFNDPNFSMDLVKDETLAFYYELDRITNGKYNFLEKVMAQEEFVEITKDGRSSVGTNIEVDSMGQKRLVKEIKLSKEPLINNRTTPMHEMWHAINEKNYNLLLSREKNQFLGEIGTVFIDHISRDFVKSLHSSDKDFCDKIDYLSTKACYNADIEKARDGYLDYLVCLAIAGSPQEQNFAITEVVDNFDKLWDYKTLEDKLRQINNHIHDPKNSHYDPMYECRYLPAQAVSKFLLTKRITNPTTPEEQKKSEEILAEQVSLMADLNNHIISLDKLNNKSLKSTFDIATNYLNVPQIEDLMSQYARTIAQANTPQNSQIKDNSQPQMI